MLTEKQLRKITKLTIEAVILTGIMLFIVIPLNVTRHYTEIYR